MLLIGIICIFSLSSNTGEAQTIRLSNPSFEDYPRHSKPPQGWKDCGFPGESAPDVQPSGTFNVHRPAVDGSTYLGMVVRDNDTWESVSQRLSQPLDKETCYEFSIYLCRSELYVSTSRITEQAANYTTPARLRVYGGFGPCDKQFILGETKEIHHTNWVEYKFKFEPVANYSYIMLEAFYMTPTLFPYNGNVLVDHASDLTIVPCSSEDPPAPDLAATEPVTNPAPAPPPTPLTSEPEAETREDAPPAVPGPPVATTPAPQPEPEQKVIEGLPADARDLSIGTTIRIDKLFFEADQAMITQESYPVLNQLFDFLDKNKNVVVEIGGHTNGIPPHSYCDKLSTERAKAVADYLSQKGIINERLQYKGYGKRSPIATNKTAFGRKRNQRVEIKILSFEG